MSTPMCLPDTAYEVAPKPDAFRDKLFQAWEVSEKTRFYVVDDVSADLKNFSLAKTGLMTSADHSTCGRPFVEHLSYWQTIKHMSKHAVSIVSAPRGVICPGSTVIFIDTNGNGDAWDVYMFAIDRPGIPDEERSRPTFMRVGEIMDDSAFFEEA